MDVLRDPIWQLAVSIGLAMLFGAAGWHKLRARAAFSAVLQSYGVATPSLISPLALCLPWLELATAVALLIPALHSIAAFIAALLLLSYASAMVLSLLQGRRIADCGCQLGQQKLAVGTLLIWRNVLLMLLALSVLQAPGARALGLYDGLVILCLLLCGCLFYQLANSLIANHYSARELSL